MSKQRGKIGRPAGSGRQRGVAMTEFAIVLPFILLLMFGVGELGRLIMSYNMLTKSLQDGARHAAAYGLHGTSGSIQIDAALDAEIRNLVVYGDAQGNGEPLIEGLTPAHVQVTVPASGWIRVSAAYPYVPLFGSSLPTFGLGGSPNMTFNLDGAVTMRAL